MSLRLLSAAQVLAGLLSPIVIPTTVLADPITKSEVVPLTEWRYDELYENGRSIRDFIQDNLVYGAYSEQIGNVEDVIFSSDGQAISVIAEVGGLWDIGDTHVSVPWDQIIMDDPRDGLYGIIIPVTEETIDEFSLFGNDVLSASVAAAHVRLIDEGAVVPRAWRATELIGDYVRVRDGDGFSNFGYVYDLFIEGDRMAALVVRSDMGSGPPQLYALPYQGGAFDPGRQRHDLPYARADLAQLPRFHPKPTEQAN